MPKRNDTIIPLQQVTYVNLSDVMPEKVAADFREFYLGEFHGPFAYSMVTVKSITESLEDFLGGFEEHTADAREAVRHLKNIGPTVYINLEA